MPRTKSISAAVASPVVTEGEQDDVDDVARRTSRPSRAGSARRCPRRQRMEPEGVGDDPDLVGARRGKVDPDARRRGRQELGDVARRPLTRSVLPPCTADDPDLAGRDRLRGPSGRRPCPDPSAPRDRSTAARDSAAPDQSAIVDSSSSPPSFASPPPSPTAAAVASTRRPGRESTRPPAEGERRAGSRRSSRPRPRGTCRPGSPRPRSPPTLQRVDDEAVTQRPVPQLGRDHGLPAVRVRGGEQAS